MREAAGICSAGGLGSMDGRRCESIDDATVGTTWRGPAGWANEAPVWRVEAPLKLMFEGPLGEGFCIAALMAASLLFGRWLSNLEAGPVGGMVLAVGLGPVGVPTDPRRLPRGPVGGPMVGETVDFGPFGAMALV